MNPDSSDLRYIMEKILILDFGSQYTQLIARVPGWCAHRVEEVIFANRIIRPAYKYLGVRQKYKPIEER